MSYEAEPWDGERCDECGRGYNDVYAVSNEVWADVHPRAPGGMLCPNCCVLSYSESLRTQLQQAETALRRALKRYDDEDTGVLDTRPGLAWAMASDLREGLAALAAPPADPKEK